MAEGQQPGSRNSRQVKESRVLGGNVRVCGTSLGSARIRCPLVWIESAARLSEAGGIRGSGRFGVASLIPAALLLAEARVWGNLTEMGCLWLSDEAG